MKRIAGIAVVAAVMSVSLVGVATAHTVTHDSAVTFQIKKNGSDPDTFEGRVQSDSDRCVADRLVRTKREVAEGKDVVVAETTTDADGEYSVPTGDLEPGTYYAVVTRKVLRMNDEHTHVCGRDVSPDRVVAGPQTK